MFINIDDTKLVQVWKDATRQLNGEFTRPLQVMNGGSMNGGMFLFNIKINYKNILVNIHTGLYEFPLRKNEYNDFQITITAQKESKENIELSFWRKDYMDRLFNFGKVRTGYKQFDKAIGLQSSKNIVRHIPRLFKNTDLREQFINEKYRAYNVRIIDNFINVNRKSAIRLDKPEMIVSEYNQFCKFLDGLIDAQIL
jgi:hypothetical protein